MSVVEDPVVEALHLLFSHRERFGKKDTGGMRFTGKIEGYAETCRDRRPDERPVPVTHRGLPVHKSGLKHSVNGAGSNDLLGRTTSLL